MSIPLPSLRTGIWLYGRYAIWRMAGLFDGLWTAYEICGHEYKLIDEALLTVISKRPFWSREPYVLDVYGRDKVGAGSRSHEGYILVDRSFPRRARRIIEYAGAERSEQNLELSADGNLIHVHPTEPQYKKHVLRRSGLLGLS